MKNTIAMSMVFIAFGLAGCANDPELGITVSQLKAEQTYNPNAWQENLGYVPDGNGQRSQVSLETYNNNGVTKEQK
ncbi:hypothetical protein RJD38_03400 [Vibrio scophthalmi]|uniref:Lipoprotein n=2 Tax=Vibrio scophthalmi TaxID=45658 RepID=F9RLF4_9VIBR|nr:hypothetical protein [Vibrio scophthalmi]ANU35558.1 hypothetical protein VSVS05_00421 [Vibrio scophthalmi]EGU38958.1 hypothetical protein VIS19158_05298 [Vibrio scophthalmi LMG 19158]